MHSIRFLMGIVCVSAYFSAEARTAEPAPTSVSFIKDVAPILKESCFGCHGAKNPKGKLDMTKYENFRKGGTKDDPITDGKPDESHLIEVLKATDKSRMPPLDSGDALPAAKIAVVERWVAEGAKLDANLSPKADLQRELRLRWQPPAPPAAYAFPAAITALAFTPDGKKLVAGGHHELTIWDAGSGKLEKRIATRARRTLALLFLPDGKLVAAGGRPGEEGDVRVYDINGGSPRVENGVAYLDGVRDPSVMLKQLLDADDEILCLALSADGKKLAAGGCDRVVEVWDLSGGVMAAKLEQTIENHSDWIFAVALSADGKLVATGSRDKTAKVWDLTTRESIATFPEHQNIVYGVVFKADGKVVYSVGDDNQVRAWNVTGEQAGKQIRNSGGHGKSTLKLISINDGKQSLLATCSADTTVRLWNPENGQSVKTLTGHTDYVYALAASPDAKLIASGSYNGEVKIWKVADGTVVKAFNASPGLATTAARKK